jgi:hypothetical protein|tara:strand:- start:275 stop:1348 length:1074 start_codon:yes stop_codon:yes gene_type:complete
MKNINFVLNQLTALRYFAPIIIEAHNRGIKSHMFIQRSGKYNCPSRKENWNQIVELAKKYNMTTYEISHVNQHEGIFFFVENQGMSSVKKDKNKKFITLTFAINFSTGHKREEYRKKADHVLMPSRFFADYYETNYENNLFLGSPKFDVCFETDKIIDKYGLKRGIKKALVIFPKNRDLHKVNIKQIYMCLKQYGYDILVKTRGKDPVANNTMNIGIAGKEASMKFSLRGDHYFEDMSWYPHTTMELIHASDLIINFGSCAIEEIVMSNRPVIDFEVKKPSTPLGNTNDSKGFAPLYEYKYAVNLEKNYSKKELESAIRYLSSNNFAEEFTKAQNTCLTSTDFNSSKAILDFFENDV